MVILPYSWPLGPPLKLFYRSAPMCNGLGKSKTINICSTDSHYREQLNPLKTWAKSINWNVAEKNILFIISRNPIYICCTDELCLCDSLNGAL